MLSNNQAAMITLLSWLSMALQLGMKIMIKSKAGLFSAAVKVSFRRAQGMAMLYLLYCKIQTTNEAS